MTNAAANAALGAVKLEQAAAAAVKSHGALEEAWKWLKQSQLRAEEAKLPLFTASGQIIEGQGEGHRLARASMQAHLHTQELMLGVRNLQDEVRRLFEGEITLKGHVDEWVDRLRA